MRDFLIKLPRNIKRVLLISVDALSIYIVFWSALMIRSGSLFMPSEGYQLTNASAEDFYLAFSIITLIVGIDTIPSKWANNCLSNIFLFSSIKIEIKYKVY